MILSHTIGLRKYCVVVGAALMIWLLSSQFAVAAAATDGPALVPWPQKIELGQGAMRLSGETRIVATDSKLSPLARILAEEITLATGLKLATVEGNAKAGDIVLSLDSKLKK